MYSNKTEDLNFSVFNMITGINESNTLTKKCKCKFDGGKCNLRKWKIFLARIMDDSIIICNEATKSYEEEINTIPTNFNEKKVTCETRNFYILVAFLLITIAL